MQAITQYLKGQGYGVVSDEYYSEIARWFEWYRGDIVNIG